MTQQERPLRENGLNELAEAISVRTWIERQRTSETQARLKNRNPIQSSLPLTEGRRIVVRDIYRGFLENPDSISEVAKNLNTFLAAEHISDEFQESEAILALSPNEQEALAGSIVKEAISFAGEDIVDSLEDCLTLKAKAEELSSNSGIPVASYFTEDELYEELVRLSFEPMEFARRKISSMVKLEPEAIKKAAVASVIASMQVGEYSEAEIVKMRSQFENNPQLNLIFNMMVMQQKIIDFTILIEQLSRFYRLETVLQIEPELKREMGIEEETSGES